MAIRMAIRTVYLPSWRCQALGSLPLQHQWHWFSVEKRQARRSKALFLKIFNQRWWAIRFRKRECVWQRIPPKDVLTNFKLKLRSSNKTWFRSCPPRKTPQWMVPLLWGKQLNLTHPGRCRIASCGICLRARNVVYPGFPLVNYYSNN